MSVGAHRSHSSLFVVLAFLAAVALATLACDPPPATQHASELRSDCYSCHVDDYDRAHGPGKRHQVPTRCAVCHLERGFHPTQKVHPWPLTGAHADADCFACHDQHPPTYEDLPSACVDCHREDYDKSDYPGHDKFPLTCADCHGTQAFKPAKRPTQHDAGAAKSEPAAPHPAGASSEPAAKVVSNAKTSKSSKVATAAKPASSTKKKASTGATPAKAAPQSEPPAQLDVPVATTPKAEPPTRESSAVHPESRFPLERGNHTDIECNDCHTGPKPDRKANTSCVSCHKRSRYDGKHQRVSDYPLGDAPAYFCVECHTQGTRRTAR